MSTLRTRFLQFVLVCWSAPFCQKWKTHCVEWKKYCDMTTASNFLKQTGVECSHITSVSDILLHHWCTCVMPLWCTIVESLIFYLCNNCSNVFERVVQQKVLKLEKMFVNLINVTNVVTFAKALFSFILFCSLGEQT